MNTVYFLNKFFFSHISIPNDYFLCFVLGLSFLDEVPCNDPPAGPRYLCRLCHHTANLAEMVHHVIGRKHRQKYVVKHVDDFQKTFVLLFNYVNARNNNALLCVSVGTETSRLGYVG